MRIRYYIDPATELPHFYKHDVSEREVRVILSGRGKTYAAGMILGLGSARLKTVDT